MKKIFVIAMLPLIILGAFCLFQLDSSSGETASAATFSGFSDSRGITAYIPPTPTLSPSPTPALPSMELYFRKAAKVIFWPDKKESEIVEEVPWLNQDDFTGASVLEKGGKFYLRVYLTPSGKHKFREAMMGNVGRTIIFSIGGEARAAFEMIPVWRKDRICIYGNFSRQQAESIVNWINMMPRPSPTPTPGPLQPSPTPRPQEWVF